MASFGFRKHPMKKSSDLFMEIPDMAKSAIGSQQYNPAQLSEQFIHIISHAPLVFTALLMQAMTDVTSSILAYTNKACHHLMGWR